MKKTIGRLTAIFAIFLIIPLHGCTKEEAPEPQNEKAQVSEIKPQTKPDNPALDKEETKSPQSVPVDKSLVARVNSIPVYADQLERELVRLRQQLQMMGQTLKKEDLAAMKSAALNSLVSRMLLEQEGIKKGIAIDEEAVKSRIGAFKKRFADEKAFQKALAGMSITYKELQADIRQNLAVKNLIEQEVSDSVTVSPLEKKEYYQSNTHVFQMPEQVRASHILIKVEPEGGQEEKEKARSLIEKIKKDLDGGADFAVLAKEHSQGPSNVRGGDLGFFKRGDMVEPFEKAAFSSEPGQTSGVVETRFGFHLIKTVEKKPSGMRPYEDVEKRIGEFLKNEKIKMKLNEYITDLRTGSQIEILSPDLMPAGDQGKSQGAGGPGSG